MNNGYQNNTAAEKAARQMGINIEKLKNIPENGNMTDALKSLPPEQAQKLKGILSDSEQLKAILSSEKARKLLKLFGGKQD